jgi:type IV secretory pathway ATPase VirB11/archaellum biosynthesis ATPase
MTYRGKVQGGVVVLEVGAKLPEGTEVQIVLPPESEANAPTLYERLEPVIGKAKGLPPDASKNVDHYLYGHPKT